MTNQHTVRLPAIRIRQGTDRTLYSFAVDGKLLHEFASVSRIRREENTEIDGYQRPEVVSHIREIRDYLESDNPMIPNALVVAFDSRVTFEPASSPSEGPGYSDLGTIIIPIEEGAEDTAKPGWLVDGQQRAAAIREARIDEFPVCVTAFITDNAAEQRSQFILVNSTKPLPKGLIYELLPQTDSHLPTVLYRRRFPAFLLEQLNFDPRSPLFKKIRTPTNGEGFIKDNSILKMLENSLSDGVLYRFRDPETGRGDEAVMLEVLHNFWSAVATVFEDAWALPPRRSRLVHGVGIIGMGFLMDAIADRHHQAKIPSQEQFEQDLREMAPVCCWTSGYWEFGEGQQRRWNELQNTSKDIQLLANYLLFQYKRRIWGPNRLTGS